MVNLPLSLLAAASLLPGSSPHLAAHFALAAADNPPGVSPVPPRPDSSAPHPNPNKADESTVKAEKLAQSGEFLLSVRQLNDAQKACQDALQADPANATAQGCLKQWASMSVDDALNKADNKLLIEKRADAAEAASQWVHSSATDPQRIRAGMILQRARRITLKGIWTAIPDWLRQISLAVLFVLFAMALFLALRFAWRETRRRRIFDRKTVWGLQPFQQLSGSTDGDEATDDFLDAIARLGDELDRSLWEPCLLLLRPTPPASYEPAVITDFLGGRSIHEVKLIPPLKDLRSEVNFHEVRLDDAVQNLQLKAGGGIDIGSLLRFLMAIWRWITAGAPTITGSVKTSNLPSGGDSQSEDGAVAAPGTKQQFSMHIAARGIGVNTVSITTSTDIQAGIDCVHLSAERAAFKFLIRMKYPGITNDEVNGLAALRQGASLFAEFAGTVPARGAAAITRTSALKSAARNLEYFRTAIPVHCNLTTRVHQAVNPAIPGHEGSTRGTATATGNQAEPANPNVPAAGAFGITDYNRQAALLAEGVAHALTCSEIEKELAIGCFRQLEDWPPSDKTRSFRLQAKYNEAVVCRDMGYPGQCVLMLTELLGEPIPDTGGQTANYHLPEPISLAARLARLFAFAQYTQID